MKKLYFTALSLFCALGFNAQTINQGNFEPMNGEQYATYQIDSTQVSAGPNGAGINWNFPAITTHSSLITSYTTSTGNFTAFPSASVVVNAGATNNSYYSGSATDLKYWGGNLSFGLISAELKFANPQFYMVYPTALNGGTVSAVSGSINAIGSNGTFTGVCTVSATATGTMVLPLKTFTDVIRVTNTINVNYFVVVSGTAIRINYDYYSLSNSKYPILTISQSSITGAGSSVQNFAFIQKNYQTVSLKQEAEREFSAQVYPNPMIDGKTNISGLKGKNTVAVYNLLGEMIMTQNSETETVTLNLSNQAKGVYVVRVTDASNKSREIKIVKD